MLLLFGMNFVVRRNLESVHSIFTVGTVGRVRATTGPRLGEEIEALARGGVEAGAEKEKKLKCSSFLGCYKLF